MWYSAGPLCHFSTATPAVCELSEQSMVHPCHPLLSSVLLANRQNLRRHTGVLGREGEGGSLGFICICLQSSIASTLSRDLASLRCEHRRIWKPSSPPLSFLTLLVSHPDLSPACGRVTGKAQRMGVGHQSSVCTIEGAWLSAPNRLLPAIWSVMQLTDGHSTLAAESTLVYILGMPLCLVRLPS